MVVTSTIPREPFILPEGMQIMHVKETFIHIDLDGVIFDFDQGILNMFGCTYDELTKDQVKNLWGNMPEHRFFEKLPTLELGIELLSTAKKSKKPWGILTACGHSHYFDIMRQKANRLESVFKSLGIKNVPVSFCKSGDEKFRFASKNHVLIDDKEKSCLPWREAGGTAFLWPSQQEEALALFA